ncbi:MAG: 5/3-nucleotidase SurE [Pseudomonadota bacterium]
MKILLTNDDSHISPLLGFIIKKLRSLGELTVVVPKHEQSWKGKSMTRFAFVHAEPIELFGHPSFTVDGTPADCVNVGIYHLCNGKPDLVVSGINAGLNAGMGFVFSSGTIGACLEGNIGGIPGIALSQAFDTETMNHYAAEYALPPETHTRLEAQTGPLLDRVFKVFAAHPSLLGQPITWNVNLPFHADPAVELRPTSMGRSTYGNFFARTEIHFEHRLREVFPDMTPGNDIHTIRAGHISITPLDMRAFGQIDGENAERLAQIFSTGRER